MSETKQPWSRLKGESTRSYAYFNEYLKLGPQRTLEKVRLKVTESDQFSNPPTESNLKNFSSKWDWVSRAEAYDDYIIEKDRKEFEKIAIEKKKKRLERADKRYEWNHKVAEEAMKDLKLKVTSKAYVLSETAKGDKIYMESDRLDLGEATEITDSNIKGKIDSDKESVFAKVDKLKKFLIVDKDVDR